MTTQSSDDALRNGANINIRVTHIGILLGCSWIGTFIVTMIYGDGLSQERPTYFKYALGSPDGSLFIQLLTYPFLHGNIPHLAIDLVRLFCIVSISSRCLTPAGFVRLYSLGSICGGLAFWLMASRLQIPTTFAGSGTAIIAVLSSLAVLNPELKFWTQRPVPNRLIWIILPSLLLYVGQMINNQALSWPLSLSYLAGLSAGVLYGLVEKIWNRYEAKLKAS